mmetsp:Transcript_30090/g.84051  ORF Transcript_30090/g.84051 Transcript_30090/m.84051 type:complete len:212 (-) Transcript_30090:579-1214(-)
MIPSTASGSSSTRASTAQLSLPTPTHSAPIRLAIFARSAPSRTGSPIYCSGTDDVGCIRRGGQTVQADPRPWLLSPGAGGTHTLTPSRCEICQLVFTFRAVPPVRTSPSVVASTPRYGSRCCRTCSVHAAWKEAARVRCLSFPVLSALGSNGRTLACPASIRRSIPTTMSRSGGTSPLYPIKVPAADRRESWVLLLELTGVTSGNMWAVLS